MTFQDLILELIYENTVQYANLKMRVERCSRVVCLEK
jgi:hypothetical protein